MSVSVEVELSPVFQTTSLPSRLCLDLEEEAATVKGLLYRLSELCGDRAKPLLFEKGGNSILSGLTVMVNDQVYTGTALNQKNVRLVDRDKVSLLYFVSGG